MNYLSWADWIWIAVLLCFVNHWVECYCGYDGDRWWKR